MTDQKFELVISWRSSEQEFTTLSAPQFLPYTWQNRNKSWKHHSQVCSAALFGATFLIIMLDGNRWKWQAPIYLSATLLHTVRVLGFFFSSPLSFLMWTFRGLAPYHKQTQGDSLLDNFQDNSMTFVFIWFCGGLKSFVRECLKCRR